MVKVYVCDGPFDMRKIDKLTISELITLKHEIHAAIFDEVTKDCPRISSYDYLMNLLDKVKTMDLIEVWNNLHK